MLSFSTLVRADDILFDADVSTDWAIADNWDGDVLPTVGDNALVDGFTASVSSAVGEVDNVFVSNGELEMLSGGSLAAGVDVSIGSAAEAPGSLTQSGGDLAVGRFLVIGDFADGDYTMSGGTATIGDTGTGASLIVGFQVGGTLTMTGGELVQADVNLGTADSLNILGLGPGGTATLDLSGGLISMSASTYIGGDSGGSAVVNQTGGVLEIRDRSLRLGGFGDEENPTSGTYNISGGTLATATGLSVGYGAFSTAEVNISADADVQVGGTIFMGISDDVNPTSAVITQTGGTVVTGVRNAELGGGSDLLIGYGDESAGEYNLSGGTLLAPGFTILGIFGSTESAMTVSGDDTTFVTGGPTSALQVGGQTTENEAEPSYDKPTFGEFTQNGGSVVIDGTGNLQIASGPAATGIYNMNGGTLQVTGVTFMTVNPPEAPLPSGTSADATFNQNGGETVLEDIALVGYNGTATINVTGGTITSDLLPGPDAESFVVGILPEASDSSVNISGGELVSAGRVRIADGASTNVQLNVSGTGKLSVGTELDPAELWVGGGLDPDIPVPNSGIANQSGGTVDVTGFTFIGLGVLEEDPTAISNGTYNMSGGEANFADSVAVGLGGNGTFVQTGGTVNAFNAIFVANDLGSVGSYELSGGVLDLKRTGIIAGEGDASFTFTGGTLTNALEIGFSLDQTGGVLSTGPDPAATVIVGDYAISGDAEIEVKIGGLTQESEHDIYQVEGVASLGGTMSIELVNGFVPQIGDLFEVLTSLGGDIIGTFDSVVFAANPGNLSGLLIYEPDRVLLEIIQGSANVPGDTDGDGDVDLTDLNNVRNNFGAAEPPIGDTDGDGDVDLDDLNAVRNNFGFVSPSPASTADTSEVGGNLITARVDRPDFGDVSPYAVGLDYKAIEFTGAALDGMGPNPVPEPATWALALVSSLGGLIAWRRRKQ